MTQPDVSFRLNIDPGNTAQVVDGVIDGANKAEAAIKKIDGRVHIDPGNSAAVIDSVVDGAKRVEGALRRISGMKPLDAARDILDIRGFGQIRREIQLVDAAYKRLSDSGKLSAEELMAADRARLGSIARLRTEMAGASGAVRGSVTGVSADVANLGDSAKQTAFAMRLLPAQFSDVATQLQGGANPFTVLLQQGLQTRDMFGGFGAMFRGLGAFLTPAKLAFAGVAGAIGAVGLAALQGDAQSAALTKAIALTGNAAGVTAGQVDAMAKRIAASSGVTIAAAREAAASAIEFGTFGPKAFGPVAEAMARYTKQVNDNADQVRGVFGRLAADPTAWAKEQNQALNFLTGATYAQIKALQEQGKTQEAASLAAQALTDKLKDMPKSMGLVETAAKAAKEAVSGMWDSLMGIGRAETVEDRLDSVAEKLRILRGEVKIGEKGWALPFLDLRTTSQRKSAEDDLLSQQAGLQEDQRLAKRAAAQQAETAATEKGRIAAIDYMGAMQKTIAPMKERAKLLGELEKNIKALAGTEQAVSDAEARRAREDIIKRTTPSVDNSAAQVAAQLRLAQMQAANAAELRALEGHATELDALRKRGMVSDRRALEQESGIAVDRALLKQKALQQELELLRSSPLDASPGAGAKRQSEIAELVSQIADAASAAERAWVAGAANIGQLDLAKARESAQQYATAYTALAAQVDQQSGTIAAAQVALIVDPIEMARAQAELSVQKIRKAGREIAREYGNVIAILRGRGDDAQADIIQAKLDKFLKDSLEREKQERGKVDADIAKNAAEEWKKATEKISDSLTDALMRGFEGGKDAAANLRDTVVNMFKTMVLRPVVQAMVNPLAQSLTGAVGQGLSSLIGGSGGVGQSLMGNAASSVFGNLGAAGAGLFGGSAAYGAAIGTTSIGAGSQAAMLASQTGVFGAEGAALTAASAGNAATAGIMSSVGAAIPYVAAFLAIAAIAKKFDKGGTLHSGFASTFSAAEGVREERGGSITGRVVRQESTSALTNAIAQGVGQMLDATAATFGKRVGYEVAAGFADDTSKDGAWGALKIAVGGNKVVDWADTQTGRWAPKEFADGQAGQTQFVSEVARSVRGALDQIGLPTWAQTWLDQLGNAPTIEQMGEVVGRINQTQAALKSLGQAMPMLSALADDAKMGLINAAGGLQALAEGLNAYETRILDQDAQIGLKTGRLNSAFAELGVAVPKTRAEFKALVEGVDASTASGQAQLAGLLRLSGSFADLQDASAQAAGGVSSLSESVKDLGGGLQDEINRIRGVISVGNPAAMAQAQTDFAITTAAARAGDQRAIDALPGISRLITDAAEQSAATRADMIAIQAQVAASLDETLAIVRGGPGSPVGVPPGSDGAPAPVTDSDDPILVEMAALREEVAMLRAESSSGASAVASNTLALLRTLERAMPGGDAVSVRDVNSDAILLRINAVMTEDGDGIATRELP